MNVYRGRSRDWRLGAKGSEKVRSVLENYSMRLLITCFVYTPLIILTSLVQTLELRDLALPMCLSQSVLE